MYPEYPIACTGKVKVTLVPQNQQLRSASIFRQLPALESLEKLHMRNTQRTINNFPSGIDQLQFLAGELKNGFTRWSFIDVVYRWVVQTDVQGSFCEYA